MALEYHVINSKDCVGITVYFGAECPNKSDCLARNPDMVPAYITLMKTLYQRGWTNVKGIVEVPGLVLEEGTELDQKLDIWIFKVHIRLDRKRIQ